MSNSKEIYRQWCNNQPNLPLFHRANWLDLVVKNGDWEVILSRAKNGKISGVLPYFKEKRYGLKLLKNPILTPFLGIWMDYTQNEKVTKRKRFELNVSSALIQQLPKFDYLHLKNHPQQKNLLSFYWKDFSYSTNYTYQLIFDGDLENIENDFNRNIKRNIRKGQENFTIHSDLSSNLFYQIQTETFSRQRMKMPFSKTFFHQLDKGIDQLMIGKKFGAFNTSGMCQAVSYLLWDKQKAYYFLAGEKEEGRTEGASILLTWEAIKFTFEKLGLPIFDFCGSMLPHVEPIRRQFGAKQVPYFHVKKTNNRLLKLGKLLLR